MRTPRLSRRSGPCAVLCRAGVVRLGTGRSRRGDGVRDGRLRRGLGGEHGDGRGVQPGGDPAYAYSATAPLPDGVDEFLLAGFIRKKRVELVKCITQDMYVPADSDIVIEGYIDPEEELILEGPFGDHTGYYSLADYYPKFHITAITHRKDAIDDHSEHQ